MGKKEEEKQLTVAEAAAGSTCRGHCLALSLSDLSVWCYECESYVQHENLAPLVKQMELLKFGSHNGSASNVPHKAGPSLGTPIPAKAVAAHGVLGSASWPLPVLA